MIPAVTKHRVSGPASTALLHFDGTNGSTTFQDVYTSTWTAVAGAALSTAAFKFGTASLLLNGSTDFTSTPNNIFGAGAADWTQECWFNCSSVAGSRVLFGSQDGGGGTNGIIAFLNAGKVALLCGNGSSFFINITGTTTVTTGTWHHAAYVRFGNIFTCYLDGTSEATVTTAGTVSTGLTGQAIGSATGVASSPFAGNIDEARISMGVARYTSNFTPSGPFTF